MSTVTTDDEARAIIAENVNRLMRELGYSQAKLAEITGESEARISYLRHGTKNAQGPFLLRLAEALNVTPNDLMLPPKNNRKKSA